MEELLVHASRLQLQDEILKLDNLGEIQKQMSFKMMHLLRNLDDLKDRLVTCKDSLNIEIYTEKIKRIKRIVRDLSTRCNALKMRLNNVREILPSNHALIDKGPFYYRCVYKGGVKFRNFPSSTAKVTGKIIEYDDIAVVIERVFLSSENSVFLHVDGYGWLFENIGNLKCMELMLYPDKRVKDREKEKVIRDTSD